MKSEKEYLCIILKTVRGGMWDTEGTEQISFAQYPQWQNGIG